MAAEERVSVKTTVPAAQKETWTRHADTLDMSQSEFVRTMVQAGRRGFELEPPEPPTPDGNPWGERLREPVLGALSTDQAVEFDEIVEAVADDLDLLVEETVESLVDAGSVEISPRGEIKRTGGADGDD